MRHISGSMSTASSSIAIDLSAAIVAVKGATPLVLTARNERMAGTEAGLPAGIFDPATHRTFELGLRSWVTDQTGLALGYVEQLYTFGDRGRHSEPGPGGRHHISVGYLALTRIERRSDTGTTATLLQPWYTFFPWEDWRQGRPSIIDRTILPHLTLWANDAEGERLDLWRRVPPRKARLAQCFGGEGTRWDEEKALERYELLYEAGLVAEAVRDGQPGTVLPPGCGEPMQFDHRRILATAIGRLRAKLKYRPVIFELMPETFTLTALQTTVEAISGHHLHKQNFRRQVEGGALVEPTGQLTRTTGRPAALFRFRREVIAERPAPGLRLGQRG